MIGLGSIGQPASSTPRPSEDHRRPVGRRLRPLPGRDARMGVCPKSRARTSRDRQGAEPGSLRHNTIRFLTGAARFGTRPHRSRLDRPAAGFTIIELIVLLGIITLLVAITFPTLSAMRRSAQRTVEMNGARQLMTAYSTYAVNNNDAALPGYNTTMSARDERGEFISSPPVRARYPWRIAPFLDYNFASLYLNEHADYLEEASYEENRFLYTYLVSVFPSMGLNTQWVGGDENYGGFDSTSAYGRFYLTSLSQAHHPDRLLVFCSARGGDPSGLAGIDRFEGYFRVLSPYGTVDEGRRWGERWRENVPAADFGQVSLRYEETAVAAMIDGHIESLGLSDLLDMRRWSNAADARDWMLQANDP